MNMKVKMLLAGGIIASQMSFAVNAETLNYSGTVTVEKGTCTFSLGNTLTYQFNEVTPVQVLDAKTEVVQSFKVTNCAGATSIRLKLKGDSKQTITGLYAGTWIVPAPGTGKASGMAYKTELKFGAAETDGTYQGLNVDGTGVLIGTTDPAGVFVNIRTTLVPTVSTLAAMTSGNMDATATIEVVYP